MNDAHFARLIPEQAKRYGQRTALRYRDTTEKKWHDISWVTFDQKVRQTAASLLQLGITEKATVGLFSPNKPECLIVDFAAYSLRAVGVPLYATSTTVQIAYILQDAAVEVLFVGEQYQYDRAVEAMNAGCGLKKIIVFDTDVRLAVTDTTTIYFKDFLKKDRATPLDEAIEQIRLTALDTDLANILYTSGTTGEPKGVLITHEMYSEALRANHQKLKRLSENQVSLCFLPMTHIFEKAWDLYCLARGFRMDINQNPLDIQQVIKEVRPTVMCAVPRFWEKVHDGIRETVNSMPFSVRLIFERGQRAGRIYHIDYRSKGLRPPLWTQLVYMLYYYTIFRIIKRKIGLERGVFFPVAGAKFSDHLCVFFRSMGIKTVHGYGLTESTATVAVFDHTDYDPETVGTVIDGLQVKIGEQHEILLKGKTITPGYHNKPADTAAAFTSDGFFRTGDAGYFTPRGHLVVSERIKDLFKTSNGKYIAPQQIESVLCSDSLIDMAAVFGDGHQYVVALIVPKLSELPALAHSLGLPEADPTTYVSDEHIHAFFEARIRQLQKNMASFEQIRRFTLLAAPFSMESNELTNTLKLRRSTILAHYTDLVAGMY